MKIAKTYLKFIEYIYIFLKVLKIILSVEAQENTSQILFLVCLLRDKVPVAWVSCCLLGNQKRKHYNLSENHKTKPSNG